MSRHALESGANPILAAIVRGKIHTQIREGFEMNRYAFPRHYEARVSARLRIEAALNKA